MLTNSKIGFNMTRTKVGNIFQSWAWRFSGFNFQPLKDAEKSKRERFQMN